jgi:hypothetical protein
VTEGDLKSVEGAFAKPYTELTDPIPNSNIASITGANTDGDAQVALPRAAWIAGIAGIPRPPAGDAWVATVARIAWVPRPANRRIKPTGVHQVHRVVHTIPVQIHAGAVSDRVGLQESAKIRIIVPGTVVVKAGFDIELPASEHKGIGMIWIRSGHLAIHRVCVALDGSAVCIGQGHHAAKTIKDVGRAVPAISMPLYRTGTGQVMLLCESTANGQAIPKPCACLAAHS